MRMSAIEALRKLPAVFTNKDAMRALGLRPEYTKLVLHRWKSRDLVRAAGPRLGVFYNLIVAPNWEAQQSTAIRLVYPSAVAIGATVLHHHGWITQIPRQIQIAVLSAPTVPRMDGVQTHKRPLDWYQRMGPWGDSILGLPALRPEAALEECRAHRDTMWCPDEDDLDIPDAMWEPVGDSPH